MAKILVTGLNPAWQKVLEFDALTPGQVNRASSCRELGSGKGQNAAIVLSRLGHDVSLVQVLGGSNGEKLKAYCRSQRIHSIDIEVSAETRVCSTLIDRTTGQVTELIEPFAVTPEDRVLERLLAAVEGRSCWDALVISGTAPTGVETAVYLEITRRVKAPLVVLDVVRELSSQLLSEVHYVKINAHEFEQLEKRGLKHPMILITDGPRAARLLENGRETLYRLPRLDGVCNPIGAGDTVTAWLTHELLRGTPANEGFREALAAGSASCLTLLPGEFDETKRQEIAERIEVIHRSSKPGA